MKNKIVVSESFDKTKIYIDDDTYDERLVIIDFQDKYDNKTKAKVLHEVADWIGEKMKPIIVLNENQYNNKDLRRQFVTGGFRVVKNKPIKNELNH